jgi:polyribonucleotide nucleotidyltransferase
MLVEKKNEYPRVGFMDLDQKIGDMAFQVVGMEAGPRKDMQMKVKLSGRQ